VKQKAFDDLTKCVRQAGKIRRGAARPSRRSTYRAADVAAIRGRLGKSQGEFALMIGVSVATLQNWEQGRRVPNGPALALLRVTAANPRLVERALASEPKRGAA
jgi:putative transcriptional regulator